MQVHIPSTIEEAVESLNGIGRLLNATKWERAAIVATYVQPGLGHGGREETASSRRLESASDFAKRKIVGLLSKDTVARYANAWLAERPRPEPGETVDLDGLPPWPEDSEGSRNVKEPERIEAIEAQAEADGTGKNMAVKIAGNAPALAAAIKADRKTAEAAAAALREVNFPMASEEDEARWYWEEENRREKGYYDGDGPFAQEAEVVSNGGRIPSLEEVNDHEPGMASALIEDAERWRPVERAWAALRQVLDQHGPVGENTEEADALRAWSFALLDHVIAWEAAQ